MTDPTTTRRAVPTRCARSASRRRPGRTATRAPGSRCSPRQGVPRDPYEKIADAATVHRFTGVAPTVALHIPWDQVDDYADLAAHAADRGRRARHDQLQRVPGRRLQARLRHQPRPGGAPQGDRPPARVRRHHGRHRLARPEAVVLRRHQLPGPGRHPRPAGPARRGAARDLRPARPATSGCCWSTSCSSRPSTRPTCPTGAPRTRTACELGERAQVVIDTGHHAPGTNIEFIVAFLLRAGQARRVRLQLPLLRRRRPDGRRGRPVPAVPDHARDRARRTRCGPDGGHRVHARPVPQHRAEDPGGRSAR